MKYSMLKITPLDIREKIQKQFPEAVLVENTTLLKIPKDKEAEIKEYLHSIREWKRLQDKNKKFNGRQSLIVYDLSFYRGEFDSQVNAYKITTVVPKILFDRARKEGLVFAVRFKSVLLEENPEGVLFWYISEEVSL